MQYLLRQLNNNKTTIISYYFNSIHFLLVYFLHLYFYFVFSFFSIWLRWTSHHSAVHSAARTRWTRSAVAPSSANWCLVELLDSGGWLLDPLILSLFELLYKLGKGCELFGIDQIELIDEVDEVLETGVQVGLCTQKHDVLEVGVVDVCIDTEQPLEDHLDDVEEVLWEGHTKSAREDLLIVQLILNPCH